MPKRGVTSANLIGSMGNSIKLTVIFSSFKYQVNKFHLYLVLYVLNDELFKIGVYPTETIEKFICFSIVKNSKTNVNLTICN